MRKRQIILMTDFGADNFYVSMMKSVIYSITENCQIIDFTHSIAPQNVKQASFLLMASQKFFPYDSIFLTVVDSGVGTDRLILGIKAFNKYFIAPDNGILSFLVADDSNSSVYKLTNRTLLPQKISSTFHGRDIFSYFTAYLASGLTLDFLGEEINAKEINRIDLKPKFEKNEIIGEVICIDNFGNLITNIDDNLIAMLGNKMKTTIEIANYKIEGIKKTFADAETGELLAYVGSLDYLEIAQNMGSAAQLLNAKTGDLVRVFV